MSRLQTTQSFPVPASTVVLPVTETSKPLRTNITRLRVVLVENTLPNNSSKL